MTRTVSPLAVVAVYLAASLAFFQCTSGGPFCAPNDPSCNSASASSSGGSASGGGSGSSGGGFVDSGSNADTGVAYDAGSVDGPSGVLLGSPTFSPPGGSVAIGTTVVILAPPDLPPGGQIFYTTDGFTVPQCAAGACTGTLYVGPVQVLTTSIGETLFAIAHDPSRTFLDSPPASAFYTTTMPDADILPPVAFTPTSSTSSNDFLVELTDVAGATICYTTDGTAPACSAAGACGGASHTYLPGAGILIDGTVTDATTGQVTVTAVACEVAENPTPAISQVYRLAVADPTMVLGTTPVPAGSGLTVPWPTGQAGLAPTVDTATRSSVAVMDPVSLAYTTSGAPPTCTTGTVTATPASFQVSATTTYQVIGCKQGYAPSNVLAFPLTLQLNAPVLASAATPYAYELDMVGVAGGVGTEVDDSANATMPGPTVGAPAGEILCATTDGSPAACAVTGGVASCTGTASSAPVVRSTGTTVNFVACAPGLTASKQATATYTLQLAPAFLATTEPAGGALGQPGWDWAGTGLPVQTMTLPAGASTGGAGYPYADGFAWNVSQVQQDATPCTGPAGAPEPTGGCGPHAYFAADYYCWSLAGAAACGAGGTCATGTAQPVTTAGSPLAVLPSGAGVTAGRTLSVVACDGDGPGEDVFAPSTATSVAF